MKNFTRLTLAGCLLVLALSVYGVTADSSEQETQQENAAAEVAEGATEDTEDGAGEGEVDTPFGQPNQISIIVAPCVAGYRADHKGKCRPVL
ncbi:uncharacterized protein LOC131209676 [Anopheles bellator]|uniref:uncharacterized protein LOC131209676 n=1 Tax=Anopheles bellator TaxID=139047 RepID=UPI002649C2F2|nr:uncharacterized protein LOC131209676 [Anopheles bellator]XP_058058778.1 uncharacterized protein LOC131209676 [Anopheles bellator]XP_058058779.1 uncharacterized protein LOC131209676 [Anopheles bellator]XP_058058780.1 uncharacterized protein LOC131209676 [Anopheles bellator]